MTVEEGSDDAGGAVVVGTVESARSRVARQSEIEARSLEWSDTAGKSVWTLS